jgi:hypothetical protein
VADVALPLEDGEDAAVDGVERMGHFHHRSAVCRMEMITY